MGQVRLLKWLGALLGLVGLVALGLWLGARAWAWLAGVLGLGFGGKILREYIKSEREHEEAQEQSLKQHDKDLKQLETETKEAERRWSEAKQEATEQAAHKADAAEDIEELQRAEDKAIKGFSRWLDDQEGSVRSSVKWLLLVWALLWLVLMQLWWPKEAASRPPTAKERARAARLFKVLAKAQATITHIKQRHSLELKKAKLVCAAKLRQRDLQLRKERAQKQLLGGRRCPTQWPLLVFGSLLGAASVGFAWGAVEWHKGTSHPKTPPPSSPSPPHRP